MLLQVARKSGTEKPFTSKLYNVSEPGTFQCICCETPVFKYADKFDSGTGWPSFVAPIAEGNVSEESDYKFGKKRKENVNK